MRGTCYHLAEDGEDGICVYLLLICTYSFLGGTGNSPHSLLGEANLGPGGQGSEGHTSHSSSTFTV